MMIAVIVKVKKKKYVPKLVNLRTVIGDFLFTADIDDKDLEDLKKDPDVVSVSSSQIIPLISPK